MMTSESPAGAEERNIGVWGPCTQAPGLLASHYHAERCDRPVRIRCPRETRCNEARRRIMGVISGVVVALNMIGTGPSSVHARRAGPKHRLSSASVRPWSASTLGGHGER
jgi:hypothetical protein